MTYTLSIETDAGTYQDSFHLGTDLRIAKAFAKEAYSKRIPKIGTRIISVAVKLDGKLVEIFDGEWCNV